ncbi:uncharacterized protein LOC115877187 [Sitophilus oryzae]|uniref:Uncharacterized protein LOC115877187 n=1 Tax=Sitophilus oryzae TaxID=7048 RepID=A0A6J2XE37_SITOR|nr:uncharacterized protein LOC115877187 [Sitophilus oryzae]
MWTKIFKYLSTTDLINFCEAFNEFEYLLTDENIVKKFDVQGNYTFVQVDFVKFIKEKVQYDHIRSLNINNLYWVPRDDLRNLLSLLPKLEELYALETNLSLLAEDMKFYGNLRALAVCVLLDDDMYIKSSSVENHMFLLKRFCLRIVQAKHILSSEDHANLYGMFKKLHALTELWIVGLEGHNGTLETCYDRILCNLNSLNTLVIKINIYNDFDFEPVGMAKVYECNIFGSLSSFKVYVKCPPEKIVLLEDISLLGPCETRLEKAWNALRRRTYRDLPYDVKAAEKIYMTRNVKDVQFEELNFRDCYCNITDITAFWDFLKAPNSRNLKKLRVGSCVLQRKPPPRKDHVIENLERIYPFQDIVENCSKLEELVIASWSQVPFNPLNKNKTKEGL